MTRCVREAWLLCTCIPKCGAGAHNPRACSIVLLIRRHPRLLRCRCGGPPRAGTRACSACGARPFGIFFCFSLARPTLVYQLISELYACRPRVRALRCMLPVPGSEVRQRIEDRSAAAGGWLLPVRGHPTGLSRPWSLGHSRTLRFAATPTDASLQAGTRALRAAVRKDTRAAGNP